MTCLLQMLDSSLGVASALANAVRLISLFTNANNLRYQTMPNPRTDALWSHVHLLTVIAQAGSFTQAAQRLRRARPRRAAARPRARDSAGRARPAAGGTDARCVFSRAPGGPRRARAVGPPGESRARRLRPCGAPHQRATRQPCRVEALRVAHLAGRERRLPAPPRRAGTP